MAINQASEIDLAVAFIKLSGLELIFSALEDALAAGRHARLRLITSDYLGVTDPEALGMLMLLQERGADVRVFECDETQSFHMKAYIFVRTEQGRCVEGNAYIGSSNISKKALTDGLEWNYRVYYSATANREDMNPFGEIRQKFQALFDERRATPLSHPWIERYQQRRKIIPLAPIDPEERKAPPHPTPVQQEALRALEATRRAGYQRGLVVMATGLGKTWLSAFDTEHIGAKRVLFVAHREEILLQAEKTFLRVQPSARVGYYTGAAKDIDVDRLFASIQTLGQETHLDRFARDHFDYVIVDEFHHAAAATYRRLLRHFTPRFLLGLTATPERTDQSDILSLCDDNLVFICNLFDGINTGLLCPFSYFGIYDEHVRYEDIPWRNGKFDPEQLSNKLATLARARHAWKIWREKAQHRTLAFCVSIKQAEFMAGKFQQWGIEAAAVYAGSPLNRSEALERLDQGSLKVIFSVDLFNEGVDLPGIDTIMMLRPTESKVLFLQQLGRGLRRAEAKQLLIVLDFIGNHRGFLNKPQALFNVGSSYWDLARFAWQVESGRLELPAGCFVNYDLELIDFLKQFDSNSPQNDYQVLSESLGRRPTPTEFFRSGADMAQMRRQFGSWWQFVEKQGDLTPEENACLSKHQEFLKEIEVTAMTRCFKMVLLESLLENDGFANPLTLSDLAQQAVEVFSRRRPLIADIKPALRDIDHIEPAQWQTYWTSNPVDAWVGKNRRSGATNWFKCEANRFVPAFEIGSKMRPVFCEMVQELVDYRLAAYLSRSDSAGESEQIPPLVRSTEDEIELPYFPNIKIACGHFKTGTADAEEYRKLDTGGRTLDPAQHFVARATGDSMNGGKRPIKDGDYLLLERITSTNAGSITGKIMAIERQDETGANQYVLRVVTKTADGRYILKATNPDYPDYETDPGMRTFARFREIISPDALER